MCSSGIIMVPWLYTAVYSYKFFYVYYRDYTFEGHKIITHSYVDYLYCVGFFTYIVEM